MLVKYWIIPKIPDFFIAQKGRNVQKHDLELVSMLRHSYFKDPLHIQQVNLKFEFIHAIPNHVRNYFRNVRWNYQKRTKMPQIHTFGTIHLAWFVNYEITIYKHIIMRKNFNDMHYSWTFIKWFQKFLLKLSKKAEIAPKIFSQHGIFGNFVIFKISCSFQFAGQKSFLL